MNSPLILPPGLDTGSSPDQAALAPARLPDAPAIPSSPELVDLVACAEQRFAQLQVIVELDGIEPRSLLQGIKADGTVETLAVLHKDPVVDLQAALFSAELELHGRDRVACCVLCSCNDLRACEGPDGPCTWHQVDYAKGIGVCSRCVDLQQQGADAALAIVLSGQRQ